LRGNRLGHKEGITKFEKLKIRKDTTGNDDRMGLNSLVINLNKAGIAGASNASDASANFQIERQRFCFFEKVRFEPAAGHAPSIGDRQRAECRNASRF